MLNNLVALVPRPMAGTNRLCLPHNTIELVENELFLIGCYIALIEVTKCAST